MKRLSLLIGIALGIVIGSMIGREPYEKLQDTVRSLGGRPEVRNVKTSVVNAASDISDTAVEAIDDASESIQRKMSSAAS